MNTDMSMLRGAPRQNKIPEQKNKNTYEDTNGKKCRFHCWDRPHRDRDPQPGQGHVFRGNSGGTPQPAIFITWISHVTNYNVTSHSDDGFLSKSGTWADSVAALVWGDDHGQRTHYPRSVPRRRAARVFDHLGNAHYLGPLSSITWKGKKKQNGIFTK